LVGQEAINDRQVLSHDAESGVPIFQNIPREFRAAALVDQAAQRALVHAGALVHDFMVVSYFASPLRMCLPPA